VPHTLCTMGYFTRGRQAIIFRSILPPDHLCGPAFPDPERPFNEFPGFSEDAWSLARFMFFL
jgi:hypothetical protein